MWIGLPPVAPRLERTFRRLIQERGQGLGNLASRYGLIQLHVFQDGPQAFVALEVEDRERIAEMGHDPDFQMLGQEMVSQVDFAAIGRGRYWEEIYSWERDRVR